MEVGDILITKYMLSDYYIVTDVNYTTEVVTLHRWIVLVGNPISSGNLSCNHNRFSCKIKDCLENLEPLNFRV